MQTHQVLAEYQQGARVFDLKNRRGHVVRIVRERYVHDSLPCQFAGCAECVFSTERACISCDAVAVVRR